LNRDRFLQRPSLHGSDYRVFWIAAVVAHYVAGDGPQAFFPAGLLVLLTVSYVTRPASRRR